MTQNSSYFTRCSVFFSAVLSVVALVAISSPTGWTDEIRIGSPTPSPSVECQKLVQSIPQNYFSTVIDRAVDGDTVRVWVKGKSFSVRFLSIDTPETHFEGKSQGIWGDKAAARLAQLLPIGSKVTIEFEGQRCDKYGRILGYVYSGTTMINRQMLQEGWAVNYCIYPNVKYCQEFALITRENVSSHRGIFSDPKVEIPYIWRRTVSGTPFDKHVGSQFTFKVFKPDMMLSIPVADRIFFMKKTDIHAPYVLEE